MGAARYFHVFSALDHDCDGSLDTHEVSFFLKMLTGGGMVGRTRTQSELIDRDNSGSVP